MHPLCLYSVGGGLVMWPCLAAREAGKVVSDRSSDVTQELCKREDCLIIFDSVPQRLFDLNI